MTNTEAALILEGEAEFLYAQDIPYARQAFNMAIEALRERKTGKWIHTGVIGNPIGMGRCSDCLEIVSYDGETGVSFEDYKFCPYCGAKMEVDE